VTRPDFAQELPLFVAQVRRLFTQLFTQEEIRPNLAVLIPNLGRAAKAESKDRSRLPSEDLATRLERLSLLQQLLEVEQLGSF